MTVTGDGGNYQAGMVYSVNHSTGLEYRLSIGNSQSRLFKPEWEFRKYGHWCYNAEGMNPTSGAYANVYLWRAWDLTSGSIRPDHNPTWTCTEATTVLMGVETWVAKTSRVHWSGFFSIAGISLNDHQTNTEVHTITVKPNAGERPPRVCGDNDYPVRANRIKERTYPS